MYKPSLIRTWAQPKLYQARRWGIIGIPYFWMALFFAIPLIVIFKISLASKVIALPPFTDLWQIVDGEWEFAGSLKNYFVIFQEPIYYRSYINSLRIAFFSTLIALLIGYPVAYFISRQQGYWRTLCLILVILPSWTSYLIRVYAWIGILKNNGLINNFLMWTGMVDPNAPLKLLHTEFAVYIGIVYSYLPFMILPLYAVLQKQDRRLLLAATDLGATPIVAFFKVTLPLSIPGIISGCLLVFIPVIGEFVIPELLGGSQTLMIGRILWQDFFNNRDWPLASAVAIVMLAIILIPLIWFHNQQRRQLEAKEV